MFAQLNFHIICLLLQLLTVGITCFALPRDFNKDLPPEKLRNNVSRRSLPTWMTSLFSYSSLEEKSELLQEHKDFSDQFKDDKGSHQKLAKFHPTPVLRHKRSVECEELPEGLPQLVEELNPYLAVNQFVGLAPEQESLGDLFLQPEMCTDRNLPDGRCCAKAWWRQGHHTAANLRAACPWRILVEDFGPDYFPR